MSTAVALPNQVSRDNTDLKGKTVSQVLREMVGFDSMGIAAKIEVSRRYLYVLEDERWRDPLKYGRDHDDPLFGFSQIGGLSPQELGDYVGGISRGVAWAYVNARQIIDPADMDRFTSRALEKGVAYPEALKRACRDIDNGKRITANMMEEYIRPWKKRTGRKTHPPLDDDERRALGKQITTLERENRTLKQVEGKLKAENRTLREELKAARTEIAELQKRLYAT